MGWLFLIAGARGSVKRYNDLEDIVEMGLIFGVLKAGNHRWHYL